MDEQKELEFRGGLLYTEFHDWIKVEEDYVIIGITDPGQNGLKDIVDLELPDVGSIVEKISEKTAELKRANPKHQSSNQVGESDLLYIVESMKAAFETSAPLSGEVIEINDIMEPAEINKAPYDSWIVKLKPTNYEKERVCLLEVDAYKELVGAK